jgi:hypothetical protein
VNARSPRDVSVNGWRSAGEIGLYEDAEVEPWERLVEDPLELGMAQLSEVGEHESERDHDDDRRTRGSVFWATGYCESQSPRVCVSARISPAEE